MISPILRTNTIRGTIDQYPDYERWTIVDVFFAVTVASLPTLNNLVPKRWDSSSAGNLNFLDANGKGGGLAFNSETKSQDIQVSEKTSTDEETGLGKQNGRPKVGTQPDWNDFHPEMKVPN